MLYREIFKIVGYFLLGFALTLLLPLSVSVYFDFFVSDPHSSSTAAFGVTFVTTLSLGWIFRAIGGSEKGALYRREGLAAVVLIWFVTPAIAGLPFLLSGTLEKPSQAYFEATSGLTTTGASLLAPKLYDSSTGKELPYHRVIRGEIDTEYVFYGTIKPVRDYAGKVIFEGIEAVSKPLLLWRSFLQWLGGLGIIVLFVAVLPALGMGGKVLFHAEVPGPLTETLTPRLKETAIFLWKTYLGLSALQVISLMMTNPDMTLFDASCLTFSTISTGGFSARNGSLAAYHNVNTEWVVLIFMLIGSINFSLYFYFLQGKFFRWKNPELIVYFLVLFFAGCFIAWQLVGTEKILILPGAGGLYSFSEAIRHGFFQVVSAQSSTGFSTMDYDKWPFASQVLMLLLIYLGGMSGSTAGGMKMIRHIMLFRIVQHKIERMFRPETVRRFKIGDRRVDQGAAITVLCFFLVVASMALLGTFLLTLNGLDPETALTTISSCINNSGMGFREAGPTDSYAFLNTFDLAVTSIWMILGRLEFFAVLVILVPAFWKEHG